ncbi:Mediator of RNA polymerase II transcription subunit 8 [Halotydeus destructor]|nr:Mediator of RNA polymerase II transcription subunit 8 [Halotydeus destructor]
MDREEKNLDMAMDVIISRCNDIKNSLGGFIFKLENEPNDPISWPTVLDNFVLISSQISNLMKILRNEKTPNLRNRIFLPLLLCPERDEELAKLTDNRVQAFNHDMVPNYLRTKPEPEIEEKERQLYSKIGLNQNLDRLNEQTSKQIVALNKIVSQVVDLVKNAKEDWESNEKLKSSQMITTNPQDTQAIIAAISSGRGLKPGSEFGMKPGPQMPMQQQQPGMPKPAPGKAPPAIKTNIRTTTQPYQRP